MSDILCIYYSRTGNTKKAMEEIAEALDAELVELNDGVDRGGLRGALRSGRDAMRKECVPLQAFQTEKALGEYQLVIVGTPVWAGRSGRRSSRERITQLCPSSPRIRSSSPP